MPGAPRPLNPTNSTPATGGFDLGNFAGEIYDATTSIAGDIGRRLGDTALWNYTINDNTLGQSEYDFRYRTFPEDIGNDSVGHYMIININVPVKSTGSGVQRTAYTAGQTLQPNEYSKVDTLRFGGAVPVGPGVEREPFSIPRYTRRIKESIALFMPNPIIFNTTNEFQEISLTSLATGMAVGAAGLVGGFVGGRLGGSTGAANLGTAASGFVQGAAEKAATISGMAGYPINPRVEVIFSRTHLRQYRLEFLLAPRNERESIAMQGIIRTLRFHSVPELDQATRGFTFVPPAEFDFTFYNKGVENLYIPRMNTCVLDQIEVDYAPSGTYSTFSSGHPVMARLSMGVREIEPLHKRRVLQGF